MTLKTILIITSIIIISVSIFLIIYFLVIKKKTYIWVTGDWGACDSKNNKYRTVVCKDNNNDVVDDSQCSQPKPVTTSTCTPTNPYNWVIGDWGTCDSKNNNKSRTVICKDNNKNIVDDSQCSQPKPSNTSTCVKLGPIVSDIKTIFDNKGIIDMDSLAPRIGTGYNNDGIKTVNDLPIIWKGYVLDDFWHALDLTTKLTNPIYLGKNAIEGAVIISGMFGQFIHEGYNFQICDESNWKGKECGFGSCSCGQFDKEHDYARGDGYSTHPVCDLDINMSIDASTNENNSRTDQMKCGPDVADAIGCCWWGRGPVQLTGRHNIKIFDNWLNENSNILGKTKQSLCKNPGQICVPNTKTTNDVSVVWLGSLFYWINSVQDQNNTLYMRSFDDFMKLKVGNTFNNMRNTQLIGNEPISWAAGIGGAINNGSWTESGSGPIRICAFLRMLKLLGIMDTGDNPDQPNCDINPYIVKPPPPKNCCAEPNLSSCKNVPWCNENKDNCKNCGGIFII